MIDGVENGSMSVHVLVSVQLPKSQPAHDLRMSRWSANQTAKYEAQDIHSPREAVELAAEFLPSTEALLTLRVTPRVLLARAGDRTMG